MQIIINEPIWLGQSKDTIHQNITARNNQIKWPALKAF